VMAVALALRGERGSQPRARARRRRLACGGARPSRRARIATRIRARPRPGGRRRWRSPFAASEDRNALADAGPADGEEVALALRGERGSQPVGIPRVRQPHQVALALRGERGSQPRCHSRLAGPPVQWRSPFAASEDRNPGPGCGGNQPDAWRSPFAASEDRNEPFLCRVGLVGRVALAHRGERG